MTARVARPWRQSYDPALAVRAGEALTIGAGDDEYPGWVWCENADGLGGWLPETVLGPGRAVADFDTRELSVSEGDFIDIEARLLGWALCVTPEGARGWVPGSCLGEAT